MTPIRRLSAACCATAICTLALISQSKEIRLLAQAACTGVSLTIRDAPDPVVAGSTLTYTIELNRSSVLANATISDTLPPGTTFQSIVAPGGVTCTTPAVGAGGTVACGAFNFEPAGLYAITSSTLIRYANPTVPPTSASSAVSFVGLQPGETLVGIDFRTATRELMGIGTTSRLYTINRVTGVATVIGVPFSPLLSGTSFGIDFQPVVDRIRVISDAEQNFRLNPNNAAIAGVDTALNPAGNMVAAAYTNNIVGATQTTLYAIDSASDQLKLIGSVNGTPLSPNGGVTSVVGSLGVDTSAVAGFDIASDGTAYALLTVGGVSRYYTINLSTGAATLVGNFSVSTITDIAVQRFQIDITVNVPAAATGTLSNFASVSSSSESCVSNSPTITTTITPLPTMALAPAGLNFGAVNVGGTFAVQTPSQTLALTQNNPGAVTWTAAADQPWVSVAPANGSGAATITVGVNSSGAPSSGTVSATVTVTTTGALNNPSVPVNLTVLQGGSTPPQGVFDTPTNGQSGITGSIPVTGWAIDDIGVKVVRICRDPVAGEPAPLQGFCNNQPRIYIGDAVLVAGARADIAATFPTSPFYDRAGWGYLLLTNFFPNQGNGTYTLSAFAEDFDGFTTFLGSKTITCSNATATNPFGAIDTPAQGGTASGLGYINFGWVLAGQPTGRFIPTDGSTIQVYIDSAPVGGLNSYNNPRADIQALFPGYVNTNGAVGYKSLNTNAIGNGVHTIAWVAADNLGAASGIGSRFFTISNTSLKPAATTSVAQGFSPAAHFIDARPAAIADLSTLDATPSNDFAIAVRHGYDPGALPELAMPDAHGVRHIRTAQLERIAIDLRSGAGDEATYRGYTLDGRVLRALPVGSTLNEESGEFAWAPGLAFGGAHDLVFVRTGTSGSEQIRVRVAIDAGRTSEGEPRLVIDMPPSGASVGSRFTVAGWSIDASGPANGAGIDTLHVWAYPIGAASDDPIWVGVAAYGGARPDVGDLFGPRFARSGYSIDAELTPGTYDVVVYAHSVATDSFRIARTVRVTVK